MINSRCLLCLVCIDSDGQRGDTYGDWLWQVTTGRVVVGHDRLQESDVIGLIGSSFLALQRPVNQVNRGMIGGAVKSRHSAYDWSKSSGEHSVNGVC